MANMNKSTRQSIVDVCAKYGFSIQLKSDGSDEYKKNLKFKSGHYGSDVFIHCDTGIDPSSGNLSHLKVAVHPSHFKEDLVDVAAGLERYLNQRTKTHLHSSSNYVGFPTFAGKDEPCGKCYKVAGLGPLEKLLSGLRS